MPAGYIKGTVVRWLQLFVQFSDGRPPILTMFPSIHHRSTRPQTAWHPSMRLLHSWLVPPAERPQQRQICWCRHQQPECVALTRAGRCPVLRDFWWGPFCLQQKWRELIKLSECRMRSLENPRSSQSTRPIQKKSRNCPWFVDCQSTVYMHCSLTQMW